MLSDDRNETFANFDTKFCGRIARVAAAACAALLLCTVIILLTVDSSNTRCPGWLVQRQNLASSIWGLVVMQAVMAIWINFIAFRWQWFARGVIDKLRRFDETLRADDAKPGFFGFGGKYEAMCAVFIDSNVVFAITTLGWVGFCSIPLLVIAGKCA